MGAGNAQAAGQMGVANALTGGLQNSYNSYLLSKVLGQQQAGVGAGVDANSAASMPGGDYMTQLGSPVIGF